jgi:hypothetical protein
VEHGDIAGKAGITAYLTVESDGVAGNNNSSSAATSYGGLPVDLAGVLAAPYPGERRRLDVRLHVGYGQAPYVQGSYRPELAEVDDLDEDPAVSGARYHTGHPYEADFRPGR